MGEKQSKGGPATGDGMESGASSENAAFGAAAGQATGSQEAVLSADGTVAAQDPDASAPAVLPSESEILAHLVSALGAQPDRCMSLPMIRERVPPGLRHFAPDNEILRWLQNFPGLLEISGDPGQEVVTLMLGRPGPVSAGASTAGNAPAGTMQSVGHTPVSGGQLPPSSDSSEAPTAAMIPPVDSGPNAAQSQAHGTALANATGDDDGMNPCTVQLRGLPFRATQADIKTFLGVHAQFLITGEPPIRLLLNRDGRPSGFARVQFVSPEAAKAAREALHKQQMNDRYIEVLACSERAGKARHRRAAAAEGGLDTAEGGVAGEVLDGASEAIERERVLQECRDHMMMPGRNHLLLSMLGIALSQPARAYLRRQNLGLKHFLARFPNEFRVEGPKGCEKVIWTANFLGLHPGAMDSTGGAPNPLAMAAAGALLAPGVLPGTFGGPVVDMLPSWTQPASTEARPSTPRGMASPTPHRSSLASAHGMATPSDWGTPGIAMQQATQNSLQAPIANQAGTAGQGSSTGQMDLGNGANWNPYWMGAAPPWAGQAWPTPWQQDPGAVQDAGAKAGEKANRAAANSGKRAAAKSDGTPAARSHAHLHPQSHPFAHRPPDSAKSGVGSTDMSASTSEGAVEADDALKNTSIPSLRLRGLPFSMSVQDVFAFFAQYDVADRIVDGNNAAQLLPKANGRPSGQAVVQMRSRYDAEVAQQALHNQWIGGRYIEVFVYGDETPEQAEALNSQLGYPAGQTPVQLQMPEQQSGTAAAAAAGLAGAADMPGGTWRPSFPAFPGCFPGGFPGAPVGPLGAPPWALNVPPPAVPGGGTGGLEAAEGGASGDETWNKLFSFLYNSAEDGGSAMPAGSGSTMVAADVSPFGPPPALPPSVLTGAVMDPKPSITTPARATLQV